MQRRSGRNLPALMGLLAVWYNDLLRVRRPVAVLPYEAVPQSASQPIFSS